MEDLIKRMKEETGVLKSKKIENAFRKADRINFVPPEYKSDAYLDQPLYIGNGQTISQPSTVAFMLELLEPKEGDKILDVGSGSGWTTALLSQIVGERGYVYGLEREPALVEFGRENIKKLGIRNAQIEEASFVLGKSSEAPYERILVSASGRSIPEDLLDQLKPGGVMVIPVKESIFKVVKDEEGNIEKEEFEGFVFVPLIQNNE